VIKNTFSIDEFEALKKNLVEIIKIGNINQGHVTVFFAVDEDAYYARGYFGYMRFDDIESYIRIPVSNVQELDGWISRVKKTYGEL